MFINGLSKAILDQFIPLDFPEELEELSSLPRLISSNKNGELGTFRNMVPTAVGGKDHHLHLHHFSGLRWLPQFFQLPSRNPCRLGELIFPPRNGKDGSAASYASTVDKRNTG